MHKMFYSMQNNVFKNYSIIFLQLKKNIKNYILKVLNLLNTHQKKCFSATSSSYEEGGSKVGSNGEEDLWSVWGRLVSHWETEWRRRNQYVRDLVRQGVPHHFRGIVWQLLAGVDSSPDKKLYASYIKVRF